MADKAKHAYVSRKNLDAAIASKVVDAYDVLFLNGEDETPAIGWVDKNGNPVVISPTDDIAELGTQIETKLATKATIEEVAEKIATKADAEKVSELETQIATKVDASEVDAKVESAVESAIVDIEQSFEKADYEISYKPDGTLVDYRDKEIRIMCPADTEWQLQNSGEGADPNKYYIGFKAYAPSNDIVNFKEDLAEIITDSTMYSFEGNDFAGIDAQGRKYSIVWLPVAKYENDTWTYYGANSTTEKYIGWYYSVEWYNADGLKIASDCIRINLSNEDCHSYIKPYYVSNMIADANAYIDAQIEAKISEVTTSYEIIEF